MYCGISRTLYVRQWYRVSLVFRYLESPENSPRAVEYRWENHGKATTRARGSVRFVRLFRDAACGASLSLSRFFPLAARVHIGDVHSDNDRGR